MAQGKSKNNKNFDKKSQMNKTFDSFEVKKNSNFIIFNY
jgi:hypothetical protein